MAGKKAKEQAEEARGSRSPQPLVAQPIRKDEKQETQDLTQSNSFLNSIAVRFPKLKKTLSQADMQYSPTQFVQMSLASALYIAATLLIITWLFVRENDLALLICLLLAPLYYVLSFIYSMQLPAIKAGIRAKRMEQELVFAGRHMLIELKSGVPLFDAMLGVSREYGEVSAEFNKIVEKVTLGVPLGVALHDVAENNPSQSFNRMMMQMANSLASGSDIAVALESSLEQISREQVIALKAYGQKLNPIVMFFMIFGVILPSLGVAFLIILVSFLGGATLQFGSSALFGILIAVGLIQFLFLSMVENSRPKFDIY